MLGSIIYSDIILCFKSEERNSLTAATEIDDIWNASIQQHEGLILVKFWPETVDYRHPEKKSIKKGFDKAKGILTKYNIPYKVKRFTF